MANKLTQHLFILRIWSQTLISLITFLIRKKNTHTNLHLTCLFSLHLGQYVCWPDWLEGWAEDRASLDTCHVWRYHPICSRKAPSFASLPQPHPGSWEKCASCYWGVPAEGRIFSSTQVVIFLKVKLIFTTLMLGGFCLPWKVAN